MRIITKILCSTLALSTLAFNVAAQEADEQTTKPRAVLFKVHDIKPVENTEGVVTHCDFLVTFYNRTTDSLRQATIDMGWVDSVTERYLIDEESAKAETAEKARQNRPMVAANAKKMPDVTTSVEMPALGAYKQATVKGSVKTEKCFLLLDNLDYNVSACSIIGKDDNSQPDNSRRQRMTASRNTSECANLFEYVDSKNPEYYGEFKDIPFSEQERLLNNEHAQDTTDIQTSYENAVKNFQKATEIMENIK